MPIHRCQKDMFHPIKTTLHHETRKSVNPQNLQISPNLQTKSLRLNLRHKNSKLNIQFSVQLAYLNESKTSNIKSK